MNPGNGPQNSPKPKYLQGRDVHVYREGGEGGGICMCVWVGGERGTLWHYISGVQPYPCINVYSPREGYHG